MFQRMLCMLYVMKRVKHANFSTICIFVNLLMVLAQLLTRDLTPVGLSSPSIFGCKPAVYSRIYHDPPPIDTHPPPPFRHSLSLLSR